MLIKVDCQVFNEGSLSTTLQVPVSVKKLPIGDDESLTAVEFRRKICEAYNEKKEKSPTLPDLPPFEEQALTKATIQFDDDDNVLPEVTQAFRQGQFGASYGRGEPFKLKSKNDNDDDGKSIFESYRILAGTLAESSMFCAMHVQPQDIEIVCFRPQSPLVQLLRQIVLQSDERLYTAVDKQHNQFNPQIAKEGVRAFTIRFRLSEFLRHAHAIAELVPKKKKKKDKDDLTDNDDANDNDDDDDDDDDEDDFLEQDQGVSVSSFSQSYGGGFGGNRRGKRRHGHATDISPECLKELKALVEFLNACTARDHEKWDSVFSEGMCTFDSLAYLLREGCEIVATTREGHLQGGRVLGITFQQTRMGAMWVVSVQSVMTDGHAFAPSQSSVSIMDFSPKLKEISELPVRPITPKQKKFLTERGKAFRKLAVGAHHVAYLGPMRVEMGRHVRADGRLMVDVATFNEHNPNGSGFGGRGRGRQFGSVALDAFAHQQEKQSRKAQQQADSSTKESWNPLADTLLFMTPPSLRCFSFRLHIWGDAYVVQMSEIVFRERAFEQLVLPQEQKDLIRAMVVNTRTQSEVDALARKQWAGTRLVGGSGDDDDDDEDGEQAVELTRRNNADAAVDRAAYNASDPQDRMHMQDDFIVGKGGGCVFLLSGPPGTGKTLTAEAVAEVLKLPLYSVTTGELGSTPEVLEERLRNVLDLAATWNCCILLDEADVFLAQRGDDVARSGLVSIFLRVIEYHMGVVFLTTNLPDKIDRAFASRINIALRYHPLGEVERAAVWGNFLEPHDVSRFDCAALGRHVLNGRQIRSVVRVSLAMCRDRKVKLSQEIIETAIKHSMQV